MKCITIYRSHTIWNNVSVIIYSSRILNESCFIKIEKNTINGYEFIVVLSTLIDFKFEQPANTELPIDITFDGIVIDSKLSQSPNA